MHYLRGQTAAKIWNVVTLNFAAHIKQKRCATYMAGQNNSRALYEAKDIKVFRSLENRGLSLKETTKKVTLFTRAVFPLLKIIPTPLPKSVLNSLRINGSGISNRCQYSKENFWIRSLFILSTNINCTDNFKQSYGYYEDFLKNLVD